MTFLEAYEKENTWHGRVIIIEIYHLAKYSKNKGWTIANTAKDCGLSIGLISENLKLAQAIHDNPNLTKCKSRAEALGKLR